MSTPQSPGTLPGWLRISKRAEGPGGPRVLMRQRNAGGQKQGKAGKHSPLEPPEGTGFANILTLAP